MMAEASTAFQAVEVSDELTTALQAGVDHAHAFYASARGTLIDQISQEDWESWDGSEEMALVSDPDGIDLPYDADRDLAA